LSPRGLATWAAGSGSDHAARSTKVQSRARGHFPRGPADQSRRERHPGIYTLGPFVRTVNLFTEMFAELLDQLESPFPHYGIFHVSWLTKGYMGRQTDG